MSTKQNDLIAEQREENKTMHTPTPWFIGEDNDIFSQSTCIAQVVGVPERNKKSLSNAKFIVTACNAHDDLVAALLAIQEGFKNKSIKWTKKRHADSDPYHPANTLMFKALTKAQQPPSKG